MPLWGNRDQYSDAPKFTVDASTGKTGQQEFGNSVFLADANEVGATKGIANPGWVRRIAGTGVVTSITIDDGGVDYSNADVLTVSGGLVNAVANVVTDANGTITAVVLSNKGVFEDSNVAISVASDNGANATFTANFAGRIGRVTFETLVAIAGTIDTDATDFANTDSGAVANSTGTADDAILPDA